MGDALGLFAGHWWYFWTEVWKRERGSGGRNWLETPRILWVVFSFSLPWDWLLMAPFLGTNRVRLLDSEERLREFDEAARNLNQQPPLVPGQAPPVRA